MQKHIKLVIFDMDGVLVDACEWHRVSLNNALKKVCNYEISLEDHYKQFNGIPTRTKLEMLVERGIIKAEDCKEIQDLKQIYTIEQINKSANNRQEKIELLKYIKNKNCKIGCYTNSIRKTAELMLEKTGVLEHIDLLITNQDVSKPKPDPEGYLLCLKKFNVEANEVIIVEDSERGVAAAKASGCTVFEIFSIDDVVVKLFKDIL